MVRAGASRTIGDQGSNDPGGGVGRRPPSWQLPVGHGLGSHWAPDTQAFPSLGGQSQTDRGRNDRVCLDRTEGVLGSGSQVVPISPVERDGSSWSVVPPRSKARRNGRGMQPAGGSRPCPPGMKNEPMAGEGRTDVRPLSVEAEEFSPEIKSLSRVAVV